MTTISAFGKPETIACIIWVPRAFTWARTSASE